MDRINGTSPVYFTLPQLVVREISQPVKIAQLLGTSGRPRNGQGNSVSKISLPERITPYLKNISSKKKNVKNATKLSGERNVRRNLNFTKIPTTEVKIKKLAKGNMNNLNDNPKEKTLRLSTRSSLLLPPNTIKDLHVKNRFKQNRFVLPQSCGLTVNSKNKYPRIFEELESCLPPTENKNAYVDSVIYEKNKKISVIKHMPQMFDVNNQSGINILHSPCLDFTNTNDEIGERIPESSNSDKISDIFSKSNDQTTNKSQLSCAHNTNMTINTDMHNGNDTNLNNPCCTDQYSLTCMLSKVEKMKEACLVNVEKEKCLSTTINNCGDLHPSLLPIIKPDDLQHNINENDEYVISLSKTEFTTLNRLVYGLEEDLSNMKLKLTTVMNVLSAINVTNKETNNETKIEQEIVGNLNNNTEIMNSTNIKSLLCATVSDATNIESNVTKKTRKTLDINLTKCLKEDLIGRDNPVIQSSRQITPVSASNKENEILNTPNNIKQREKPRSGTRSGTRRRSTRLIAKALNNLNAANDSFVDLENELNIVNVKSNTTIPSITCCTPTTNECKDKKVGKPLKEYMVLKSRMSCLLTPNIKRFNSLKSENNSVPRSKTGDTKASLSDKILADLYNLYEDSIDAE